MARLWRWWWEYVWYHRMVARPTQTAFCQRSLNNWCTSTWSGGVILLNHQTCTGICLCSFWSSCRIANLLLCAETKSASYHLLMPNNNNNNTTMMITVLSSWQSIARVHPLHLMNADWVPDGHQPSDHVIRNLGCESASRLLPSTSVIDIYYYYSAHGRCMFKSTWTLQ